MEFINKKIIGASGYIGQFIFEKYYDNPTYQFYSRDSNWGTYFDLSYENFQLLNLDKTSILILLSSISSPDICKKDYSFAKRVNIELTSKLIDYGLSQGSKIIFFSSDTVYGEARNPTKENAKKSPIGEYGEMKFAIEEKYKLNPNFKSIRLSYVFSHKDKFSNYIKNISIKNKVAEIYHPLFRNVVAIDDVIEGLERLSNNWSNISNNAINFGGPEMISRKDVALTLKNVVYENLKYEIIKPKEDFYLARPKYIALDISSFRELLERQPLSILEFMNLNKDKF